MSIMLVVLLILLFGVGIFIIYCKQSISKAVVPLLLLVAGDFLLLYAKFTAGDPFLSFVLHVPAFLLLSISILWFVVLLIKNRTIKKDLRKKAAITLSLAVSTVIVFAPSLSREDKFSLYENDFNTVADAIFQAYDEGKLTIGEQFGSPPYNKNDLSGLEPVLSDDVIRKMKKLNRYAGIYAFIAADADVVYFSYGAVFQSISGVAVVRNDKDPSEDEELKDRFFDGAIRYLPIGEDAFHFSDGL